MACGWRRTELPYFLYGPIVITGPYGADGSTVGELPDRLTAQVRTVFDTVRETTAAWRVRLSFCGGVVEVRVLFFAGCIRVWLRLGGRGLVGV
ncbi:hypothetical protein CG740_35450 [Streptomyces sp. CB01201]|nr:hypothetical protein CG740_35450 [Streptomyces sp. CB01201]